jgi:hypothetical protein
MGKDPRGYEIITHRFRRRATGGGRRALSDDLLAYRSARRFLSKEVPLC